MRDRRRCQEAGRNNEEGSQSGGGHDFWAADSLGIFQGQNKLIASITGLAIDTTAETTVEARALSRSYGAHVAVDTIDLTLRRGEVLGLLGPNGAGKTTTMQMLTGNLAPSAGSISLCGVDLIARPVEAKRKVGYLPEHPPLYRELTVDEYLRLAAKLRRVARDRVAAAVDAAKARCGLAEVGRRLVGALSRGFQQRVGIAQAIVHEPEVVILDEPTVGLDPNQIREIRALIRELGRGRSVILSTHILTEVETVCDRVEIMHRGKLVLSDSTAAIGGMSGSAALEVHLRRPPSEAVLAALPGVARVERRTEQVFRIEPSADAEPIDALLSASVREGWGLYRLGPAHSRIEEVFVRLTRGEGVT